MIGGTKKSCGCPLGCCCIHGTDTMDEDPTVFMRRIQMSIAQKDENARIIAVIAAYQARGDRHPLTCGNDSRHENLVGVEVDDKVILACRNCDYVQQWIPGWIEEVQPEAFKAFEETCASLEDVSIAKAEEHIRTAEQEFAGDPLKCSICGSCEWVDKDGTDGTQLCEFCVRTAGMRAEDAAKIDSLQKQVDALRAYREADAKTIGELENTLTDTEGARNELQRKYNHLSKMVERACLDFTSGAVPYLAFGSYDGPDDDFVPPKFIPNLNTARNLAIAVFEHTMSADRSNMGDMDVRLTAIRIVAERLRDGLDASRESE